MSQVLSTYISDVIIHVCEGLLQTMTILAKHYGIIRVKDDPYIRMLFLHKFTMYSPSRSTTNSYPLTNSFSSETKEPVQVNPSSC